MVIALIVLVCILMMIAFFSVTIAGGRAHDRQNAQRAEAERKRNDRDRESAGGGTA